MKNLTIRVKLLAGLLLTTIVLAACEIEGEPLGDNTPPGSGDAPDALAVSAPADMSQEATGTATVVTLGQAVATGGDGSYIITNDASAGGFSLGSTPVIWTATDGSGATATDTQQVTLLDTTAPVISGISNIQVSSTGALTTVTLTPPSATDIVDGSPALVSNAPAGGFPMGVTPVMWTATDASGNAAEAMQMVTVTAPGGGPLTLTAPADVSAEATAAATPLDIGVATASGGQGQLTITNNGPATGFPVGATNVLWTVVDDANVTATANQMVVVNDTQAPTITAPADIAVDQNGTPTPVTLGASVVSDIADPNPMVANDAPAGGFPVGVTTVVWTATDASGNSATDNQIVSVNAVAQVMCSSLQPEFSSQVYPVLDKTETCGNCHTPNNVVSTANGFNITANDEVGFDLFRAISDIQIGGTSSILVKGLGGSSHGGGNRFVALGDQDTDYQVLEAHVLKLQNCIEDPPVSGSMINYGTPYEQVYKLTMALGARLPDSAEIVQLEAAADQTGVTVALASIADTLMTEESFFERLQEIYNDVLLTNKNQSSRGQPLNQFNLNGFVRRDYYESFSGNLRNDLREAANYGFARAPIELIRYVVENDLPFTEILTADYMMVNPYSATILGVDTGDANFPFSSDNTMGNHDRDDFRPTMVLQQDDGPGLAVPMAGVVATHAWLDKYLSTNSNVNRHRARYIFYDFLGVDIEGLAPRDGLDLNNVIGSVPTFEDPQCTVCHDVMDPVAGLFKNRSNSGLYLGDRRWQHEFTTNGVQRMLAPGYTDDPADELPAADYADPLSWLMARVATDDRFAAQTVRVVFEGFTRIDATLPSTTQFLTTLKDDFVAGGFDLKSLVRDIVSSDYFLAANLDPAATPGDYSDIGTGRLLTPEELDRKLSAVIGDGYEWRSPNSNGTLSGRYLLTYGGIDSDGVTERQLEPNTLIDGVQERIAYQVACERVALELNGGNGNLFPIASISDTPGSNLAAIRENIRHLFRVLLGEDAPVDGAEVDAALQLFEDVQAAGVTAIPNDCRGGGGATDSNGTVIPWMAVVAYVLSDFRFTYQ